MSEKFQSPISGSQTTMSKYSIAKCVEFQSPISGSQTFNRFLERGASMVVSIPYKRVTNLELFVLFVQYLLFQSPISGSQTEKKMALLASALPGFNPL